MRAEVLGLVAFLVVLQVATVAACDSKQLLPWCVNFGASKTRKFVINMRTRKCGNQLGGANLVQRCVTSDTYVKKNNAPSVSSAWRGQYVFMTPVNQAYVLDIEFIDHPYCQNQRVKIPAGTRDIEYLTLQVDCGNGGVDSCPPPGNPIL